MMENKKINFWSRMKIAIAKLEDYSQFLEEKTSVAVKYFLLIVLVLAVGMSLVETYSLTKMVNKAYEYVQNELPEFSYENGKLSFAENVNAYDAEYDIYMIADTSSDVGEEKLQEYKAQIQSSGLIFLENKVIYKAGSDEFVYEYSEISKEYGIGNLTKEAVISKIKDVGIIGIAVTIFITLVVGIYIIQVISIFTDWLIMAIFAHISARISKVNMPFRSAFNISIYALTLSIILMLVYNIAYYLWGFYTEYFRIIYLLIAYVYIVAVILLIKSDLVKQQIELTKIAEVQKQVHKELNPEKKDEEEHKESEKPEPKEKEPEQEAPGEPDGSEV